MGLGLKNDTPPPTKKKLLRPILIICIIYSEILGNFL